MLSEKAKQAPIAYWEPSPKKDNYAICSTCGHQEPERKVVRVTDQKYYSVKMHYCPSCDSRMKLRANHKRIRKQKPGISRSRMKRLRKNRYVIATWNNRAYVNDHSFVECSHCGHKEPNYRAVKIGNDSDTYTEVLLHYCPKCGCHMKLTIPERSKKQARLERAKIAYWNNRAYANDHAFVECSHCKHQEPNYKAVRIGKNSDSYIGVLLPYCPNCGFQMRIRQKPQKKRRNKKHE